MAEYQQIPVRRRGGGPKTAQGKRRSSLNALQHGFSNLEHVESCYRSDASSFAKMMCGENTDKLLFEKALAVAQCDLTVREIRGYKQTLLERLRDPMSFPTTQERRERAMRLKITPRAFKTYDRIMQVHPPAGAADTTGVFDRLLRDFLQVPEDRPDDLAFLLAVPDLVRVSRYERRAWSRRARAFREFVAATVRLANRDFQPA